MVSARPIALFCIGSAAILASILTLPVPDQDLTSRSLHDIEGREYRTVLIGDQWWMAENLNVVHYSNGDAIPQVRDSDEWEALTTGAWCFYGNDPTSGREFGRLYNWYAISDPRGLAPKGWHVPTDDDWKELEAALGMHPAVGDAQGWFGSDEGMKLKSTTSWNDDGGGIDSRGFSALPGGFRGLGGSFYQMGNDAVFWSSSDYGWDLVWYRALRAGLPNIRRKLGTKMRGFSVRCVQDREQ